MHDHDNDDDRQPDMQQDCPVFFEDDQVRMMLESLRSEGLRMRETGTRKRRTRIRRQPNTPRGTFRKAFVNAVAAEDPQPPSEDELKRLLGRRPSPGDEPG